MKNQDKQDAQFIIKAVKKDLGNVTSKTCQKKDWALLRLIEMIEPLAFAPDARKGEFSLIRWLNNGVSKDTSFRPSLGLISVHKGKTISCNGKTMLIYNNRLNGLKDGLYYPVTLNEVNEKLTRADYDKCIPEKFIGSIEFKINDFSCNKDDQIIFRDGKIINNRTEKEVGCYSGDGLSEYGISFSAKQLEIALDKSNKDFKMKIANNNNNKSVLIQINNECQAVICYWIV